MKPVRTGALVLPMLVAGALLAPSPAFADTYCVAYAGCPAGATVEVATGKGIQEGLTAASAHPGSSVLIGPGSFSLPNGFSYSGPAVTIAGAGAEATRLTRAGETATTVLAISAPSTATPTLRDLTIAVPAANGMTGLSMSEGTAESVGVRTAVGSSVATGVSLGKGAVFSNGEIKVSEGTGMSGGGEVSDSLLESLPFVVQASSGARFRRDRFHVTGTYGVLSYFPSSLLVEDSLIDLRGDAGAHGVTVVGNSTGDAHATLRGLTIVNGGVGSSGVEVEANHEASSTVTVADVAIYGVEHPIAEAASETGSSVSVTAAYSSFDAIGDKAVGSEGASTPMLPVLEDQLSPPLGFLSPVLGGREGDWRLAPGSALIDRGSPEGLSEGESTTDLAGNPRVVHGRRDVGAYEYQWQPPSVRGAADRSTVEIGKPVTFAGSGSTSEPGDSIATYRWSFDDGTTVGPGMTAQHAFSQPGPHTGTLTVTDLAGLKASVTVAVTATIVDPCHETAGKAAGCAGRVVRNLKIAPRTFRPASHGSLIAAHGGGKVTYEVEGGVSLVGFTLTRIARGVKRAGTCAKRGKHSHGPSCALLVKVTKFSRISPAGGNGFRLTGRINGRRLTAGSYRLTAVPASGSAASGASVLFQLLR